MAKIKNEFGQLVEHWYEVRCYICGQKDPKVFFAKSRKRANQIFEKEKARQTYEACYIAHMTEDEEID